MNLLKICLLFTIFLSFECSNSNPGVMLSVKPKLIDDLKMKFLPEIIKIISEQNLPDVRGILDIPIVPTVSYILSNLHLSIFNLNPQTITTELQGPNRVVAYIRGPTASINGHAEIKGKIAGLIPFTYNTEIHVAIKNLNIDLAFSISRIANGQRPDKMGPLARIEDVRFQGNLDIVIDLPGGGIDKAIINELAKGFISVFNSFAKGSYFFNYFR